jgi:four helix bundle protein
MGGFRDLIVWQKSIDLVTEVYRNTSKFPREEIFALTSQIRRCAVSIPSNIAEGEGRKGAPEFARFLRIAQGSLAELQTQLIVSERLGYLPQPQFETLFQIR